MRKINTITFSTKGSKKFELTPIADTLGMPLFRQAKRSLTKLIESGKYAPGDCLPSESVIANGLQISIGTLRKAVDELVSENVLIRRQGKGTFVATHNNDRYLFQFFHIEKRVFDVSHEHEFPDVDCLAFEKTTASEEVAAALRIQIGDPVFKIGNKLKLHGRAVVYDQLWVSTAVFKGLTEKKFLERQSTIYDLYQREFGISVLRAQERARAILANRDIGRVLGLAPGMPVIEVHRTALTFGEKPVEYRISTINTQDYDYVSLISKRN